MARARIWGRSLPGAAVVAITLACGLPAQDAAPAHLSLDQILARMEAGDDARLAALKHYTSTRAYALRNSRFGTQADLNVEMQYRHPGAKTFQVTSEKGSRIIRDRVLKRMLKAELEAARPEAMASTRITPRNYVFTLLGTEARQGRNCYILDVNPKVPNKFLFRGRVWVDAEDFAVSRIEGSPAVNPSFWLRKTTFVHEYRKFGAFWLPVSNRSSTDVRVFGRTDVSIDYSRYRINEGASAGGAGNGRGVVTLEGVGSAGDDWQAGPAGGKSDVQY